MATCCICGQKIGGWGEDKLTLDESKSYICCYKCAPLIRDIEKADSPEILQAKSNALSKLMSDHETIDDVQIIIKQKIEQIVLEKGYTNVLTNPCPICGYSLSTSDSACPECGLIIYNNKPAYSTSELASIYNKRYDQYSRNPLYEYKVETIMDSAILGKFDKEAVEKVLTEYATQGWHLHSSFSNEVGKNAAVGINATINQTILIFERCIKA